MDPLHINEIFLLICTQINKCWDLLNLASVCKYNYHFIKNNKWSHLFIYINKEKKLLSMLKNYNFTKLCLEFTDITDASVSLLTNLHTLNLFNTRVTDAS